MNTGNLEERIAAIAKRTGCSKAEIRQTLLEQADRLLGESSVALRGRSAGEIIAKAKLDRRKVTASVHTLSRDLKRVVGIAAERLNFMQSILITLNRRMGTAKALPGMPEENDLLAWGGYLNSIGRTILPDDDGNSLQPSDAQSKRL